MAYETLRHLQANVPGVLDDHDIEFVHQARVALRRLRSLQKIFPSLVPHHDRENVLSRIKELAATLGQVRDLDVFLTETLPPLEEALAMSTDFTPLKAALARARQHSQNKVVTALTSPDYGRLLIQLLAGLHAPQSATEKPNGKLRDVARPGTEPAPETYQKFNKTLAITGSGGAT
ncbi:CHAD domain-containing protein [Paludibacterium denitrificans]|nr:CHAD domain-containing protein [Paludibacterium denitrificans]